MPTSRACGREATQRRAMTQAFAPINASKRTPRIRWSAMSGRHGGGRTHPHDLVPILDRPDQRGFPNLFERFLYRSALGRVGLFLQQFQPTLQVFRSMGKRYREKVILARCADELFVFQERAMRAQAGRVAYRFAAPRMNHAVGAGRTMRQVLRENRDIARSFVVSVAVVKLDAVAFGAEARAGAAAIGVGNVIVFRLARNSGCPLRLVDDD